MIFLGIWFISIMVALFIADVLAGFELPEWVFTIAMLSLALGLVFLALGMIPAAPVSAC